MGSDQLIELLSEVCNKLLPVAGLVLLVFIIVFFKHLIITMKKLTETLNITNEQVRKLDKPLETVEELSETVDKIHEMSKGVIGKGLNLAASTLDAAKDKLSKKHKGAEETEGKDCGE